MKHSVKLSVLVAGALGAMFLQAGAAPGPKADVRVGTSFVIEPPVARYVAELDPREMREQIRDWAVLGTVTRLGASARQVAAATYELPPARLPYLDELYAFEYGRGRRIYLGSRVLLFRDSDDPDPQATIARLADRVREESGAIPPRLEIYLVHDQRDEGTILVERDNDVTGGELFSAAYGYLEGKVESAVELGAWLARVDDLSFAKLDGGQLVLGGRRFAKTRTANVTVEDVAALYKAHGKFGGAQDAARKTLEAVPPITRRTVERAVALSKVGKYDQAMALLGDLVRRSPGVALDLEALVDAAKTTTLPVRGPGFSLDPEWIPDPSKPTLPLMLARMRAFVAAPCDAVDAIVKQAATLERAEPDPTRYDSVTRRAVRVREVAQAGDASACASLRAFVPPLDKWIEAIEDSASSRWEVAMANYYQLETRLFSVPKDDPQRAPAMLSFRVLQYYEAETRSQCARYEGTAETDVGMTMFYTDLLAKLWMSIDHGLSAPTLEVPGFPTDPGIDRNQWLAASGRKNPDTRVWFGPRDSSVSRVGGAGISFLFDHGFVRIYAAGSDPSNPGLEAQPNEVSRRTIGWWNRHYDDVADYEPEFHRLNQIMKWSLVTGALSGSGAAQYLDAVSVPRAPSFDAWYRTHQGRLRLSGAIASSSSIIAGKECLPIFESTPLTMYGREGQFSGGIYGGVGAASRDSIKRVPRVEPAKPLGARKPPAANLTGDKTGTALRATPRRTGTDVGFDNAARAPTRDATRDIILGKPKVSFKSGAKPGSVEIHAGERANRIGTLVAERNGADIKLKWRDEAVESSRRLTPKAPKNLADADALARDGDVHGAVPMYEAAAAKTPPTTVLERARLLTVDAAHRRPTAVLNELNRVTSGGTRLSSVEQELLVRATDAIGTPRAAAHLEHALEHGLPISNSGGRLVVERGAIKLTRDIEKVEVTAKPIPPATNLYERGVFIDTRFRVGQEGAHHDVGGRAARWQHRPDVRMAELKQQPTAVPRPAPDPHPDQLVETSSGIKFDYIPPSRSPGRPLLPPIVIQKCDDSKQTFDTSDDCTSP